jgi:coproporphyrinogen III oxidase
VAAVKQVDDLAAFNAAAERLVRAAMGGGSISTSLLEGDVLEQVQVKGREASAVRRSGNRVSFVTNGSGV